MRCTAHVDDCADLLTVRAPAEGKPLPTELRRDAKDLKRKIELEDDNTAVPRTHMDDEYAHAGEWDPKVRLQGPAGAAPP